MRFALSTWQNIETWLKTSQTIVIPIGSMEQHGPNGFIGTDALCPEIIAVEAERNAPRDILVGPTFNVGSAQHHLAFPGTITLRPSTMIAAMADWTRSLMRHGFRKLYWLNGHGGNAAPIEAAFAEIRAERSFALPEANTLPGLDLVLRNWWELSGVMSLCEKLYPVGDGSHATASEISVTYYGYPDHQPQGVSLSPKIAPDGEIGDALQYQERFPDGRIGSDPSQASAADGQAIVKHAADALIKEIAALG